MYTSTFISTTLRVATLLHVLSVAICQYPMQPMPPMPFQFPQQPAHLSAPMVPVPPLPPNFMPPQMPMRFPMPHKMPSVVMPYYKPKSKKSRRKKSRRYESEETDSSESTSREYVRKSKRRRQVLTPVVSYVTRDGYVVYQKKIKKDKARDWLEMSKKRDSQEMDSGEERMLRKIMRRRKNNH